MRALVSVRARRLTRGAQAAMFMSMAMLMAGSSDGEAVCAVVTPGAVIGDGGFVLVAAPTVGQALRGDFGALVGPLGCFDDAMPPPVFGDLDGDGLVNGSDLGSLLGEWGPCPGCPADLDGSGIVDGSDLGALLGAWTG